LVGISCLKYKFENLKPCPSLVSQYMGNCLLMSAIGAESRMAEHIPLIPLGAFLFPTHLWFRPAISAELVSFLGDLAILNPYSALCYSWHGQDLFSFTHTHKCVHTHTHTHTHTHQPSACVSVTMKKPGHYCLLKPSVLGWNLVY
jgi:hypothetical protein